MSFSEQKPNRQQHFGEEETLERLQKVLAKAGVASRRTSEDLIRNGRVKVNGETVTMLGTKVDPTVDKITVDNRVVLLDETKKYVLLNKPAGVVSTLSDEQGRPDLSKYTKQFPERLYNVGRLDAETTGLLLLTNDGELAHVMSHPSFEVQKTYIAKVAGKIRNTHIQHLLQGVELEDGITAADRARKLPGTAANTSLIELTLHSGKNRIVRRMLKEVGFPVLELARLRFGPLHLGTLPVGEFRELHDDEVSLLLSRVDKAQRRRDKKTKKAFLEDESFRKPRPAKPKTSAKGEPKDRSREESQEDKRGTSQASPKSSHPPKRPHVRPNARPSDRLNTQSANTQRNRKNQS